MYKVAYVFKVAALVCLGSVLACGRGTSPRDASAQPEQSPAVQGTALAQAGSSQQAPAFSLTNLTGETVSLETYRGKVLIIDFWATWCPPCVKEIPHFVELYDIYNEQGFEILGVSVDRGGPGTVEKFVKKNSVNYDIAMANMEVVDAYEIYTGIPTTYIIDREGNVVEKVIGYRDKSFFEDHLKNLL